MIAAWMGYCMLITAVLGLVAALAERIAEVQGWPRRGIWLAAILAAVLLVALSPRRAAAPAVGSQPVTVVGLASPGNPTGASRPAVEAAPERVPPLVRWRAIGERMEWPLIALWLAGSLGVAGLFFYAAAAMAGRRRAWRETMVDGEALLVAEKDGPAVAGFFRPRVVLPAWALSLDQQSRGFMLAHEREHLRARDQLLTQAAGLTLLVLPWNLPLWWMLRRLRLAVEVDCDARVLGTAGSRPRVPAPRARAYGEVLLEVATRRSRRLAAAPALLEHTTALGRRIMAMHPRLPRFPRAHNAALGAAALFLAVFAEQQAPPSLSPLVRRVRPAGWVFASQLRAPVLVDAAHPERALPAVFPALASQRGPSIVVLARASDGTFQRGVLGRGALGPVRERLAEAEAGRVEPLAQAGDSLGWRRADVALFGDIPPGEGARAAVSLPVRPTSNAAAIDARRLAAGEAGPGVVYLFVITLKDDRPAR